MTSRREKIKRPSASADAGSRFDSTMGSEIFQKTRGVDHRSCLFIFHSLYFLLRVCSPLHHGGAPTRAQLDLLGPDGVSKVRNISARDVVGETVGSVPYASNRK
jgi:hypothetical protein